MGRRRRTAGKDANSGGVIADARNISLPPNRNLDLTILIYNQGIVAHLRGNPEADAWRIMLERSDSTYVPNKDHSFRDALTGFQEITVGGYSRLNAQNLTINRDDLADAVRINMDPFQWVLSAGETVKGYAIYRQVGGDDSTPANDDLLIYGDETVGVQLPVATGNAKFDLIVQANGLVAFQQV